MRTAIQAIVGRVPQWEGRSPVIRPLRGTPPGVARSQLWWPQGKVAGRYLTGFVAEGGRPDASLVTFPVLQESGSQ